MILLSAMAASWIGRLAGETLELRLMVSCGAAAGLAAAYHTPLAGAVFVAEILLGSLVLAQLGPVVVAAVVSHGITIALVGPGIRFPMATIPTLGASQAMVMLAFAPISGIAGAALLYWLELARRSFTKLALPLPLPLVLGGLVIGVLSLWRPEVWGNGDSGVRQQIDGLWPWQTVALVLAFKLLAVAATTGSGAPGGVFTPTLFVGAAFGALLSAALAALGYTGATEPVYAVLGMATLLAGTTHVPVMAALMVAEMTGQYSLLAVFLPACVVTTLVSQRLHPRSIYGLRAPTEEPES
jgi:CIC family chloride channel protein